tara:strand:- start:572 stop:835 length:264 start_codon:yes stop_codon:yes gene_type:complete
MNAIPICFWLLAQLVINDADLALDNAGNNNDAKIDIIAITTNNSMSVKRCHLGYKEFGFMADPPVGSSSQLVTSAACFFLRVIEKTV